MTLSELNKIIENDFGENAVLVADNIYPEAEELYLISPVEFDKAKLAAFYQKYDYAGIRNALELARNIEKFKADMMDAISSDNITPVELTPSQIAYLEAIGWNVPKMRKMGAIKDK